MLALNPHTHAQVIKGFDEAVMGLEKGGQRKLRIEPEKAYGQPDPQLVMAVPASGAPQGLEKGSKVRPLCVLLHAR